MLLDGSARKPRVEKENISGKQEQKKLVEKSRRVYMIVRSRVTFLQGEERREAAIEKGDSGSLHTGRTTEVICSCSTSKELQTRIKN